MSMGVDLRTKVGNFFSLLGDLYNSGPLEGEHGSSGLAHSSCPPHLPAPQIKKQNKTANLIA